MRLVSYSQPIRDSALSVASASVRILTEKVKREGEGIRERETLDWNYIISQIYIKYGSQTRPYIVPVVVCPNQFLISCHAKKLLGENLRIAIGFRVNKKSPLCVNQTW